MGHRRIENTLVYTHLVDWKSDNYICKTAETAEEAKPLIESGFEHVTAVNWVQMFRKLKFPFETV